MIIAKALIAPASCALAVLALGFGAAAAWGQTEGLDAPAVKFGTLHSFSGAEGNTPQAGLVQATNGDLYGTTAFNGTHGWGTIFKITPNGALTTLYNFCPQPGCADGSQPNTALTESVTGDLYGATWFGGIANPSCYLGSCGTIFKIKPGAFTTVYSFCAQDGCSDGSNGNSGPRSLVAAANGDLFGTTSGGGLTDPSCSGSCGTIFKLTPGGTLTTLYSFCSKAGCSDGYNPGPLVQARNGDLYGTTEYGGLSTPSCVGACGTLFKITPNGTLTTLYSFCSQPNCSDGAIPYGTLAQAANGDLYGTTLSGGNSDGLCFGYCGTIFKVTPGGTLTTLYRFCSAGCTDGNYPTTGLQLAASGNLYGTTQHGGATSGGTIFKITPTGALTTLYSFCSTSSCTDGRYPEGLVQSISGIFYGTAENGGANGFGNIFAFSTGEAPFVLTRPTIGIVGEVVTLVGYGLKGATSVTFNGTPATILSDSSTVIYAKVPTGATTGKVQVVTPKGTLTSNVAFEVVP